MSLTDTTVADAIVRGWRIGGLLPGGGDAWWRVTAGDEWEPVANSVTDAVTSYVMVLLGAR